MKPSHGFAVVLAITAGQALGQGHQAQQPPPVRMGTSGGQFNDRSNAFCCGGTLGALVRRDGVLHILSNNHILARSGSAATGDDTVQPALIDSGCNPNGSNIVGDFAGNIVPLGSANVDAAISAARSGMVDTTGAILAIGVPCAGIQPPTLNLPVMKSGRTTGFTTGTITSINTSVQVQYQKGCNQGKKFTVAFTNQIVTTNMSAGGDSGSLTVSNDGTPNPVGLLFAGSSSATIHNPAQHVANAFSAGGHTFSFVGSACQESSAVVLPPAPDAEEIARVTQIKVESENDLLRRHGVWGVGVGSAANDPQEAVIVVYLERPANVGPTAFPAEIDGVKVRVIFTDPFVAQ